jgi:hypothetical protein
VYVVLQWGRVHKNAEGVLMQDPQYQQLNSKIASALRIFSGQRPVQPKQVRISLNINARAATE